MSITSIYPFALHAIVFSTLVFLLTAVLVAIFRKSAPAVFLCCFGGITIAGVLPAIGLLGHFYFAPQVQVAVPNSLVSSIQPNRIANDLVAETGVQDESTDDFESETSIADTSSVSLSPLAGTTSNAASLSFVGVAQALLYIWLAVSIVMILRFAFAIFSMYKFVSRSQPMDLRQTKLLSQTASRLAKENIELRTQKAMSSPVAAQWPRRAIIVPDSFLADNAPETAARVIEHERAHILRRDQMTLLVESFLSCFYWFHPLFHFLRGRLHQSREDICDNWVLTKFQPTDYCRDLVSLDQQSSRELVLLPGFVSRRNIGRRVRSLLSPNRQMAIRSTKTLKWLLSIVSISVVGFASLTAFVFHDSDSVRDSAQGSPEAIAQDYDMKEIVRAMRNFKIPKTLRATVIDAVTGTPIESATAQLILVDQGYSTQSVIAKAETGMDGRFAFDDLDKLPGFPILNLVVAVSHQGHGSSIGSPRSSVDYLLTPDDWKIKLPESAVLSGKVVEPDGTPVAGAWVYQPMFLAGPLEDVISTKTKADGSFEISDHVRYEIPPARDLGGGFGQRSSGTGMMVLHPEYGRKRFVVTEIPGKVTVEIRKGFTVTGRVIDKSTGAPMKGIVVSASGHNHRSYENATTNEKGVYTMVVMPDSEDAPVYGDRIRSGFNIWARHPKLGCAAQMVTAVSGESTTLADFELASLLTVRGKVIDDETDKPLVSDGHYTIHWYGDSRPNTTGECKTTPIKPDGTFEMKVVPGKIRPYIGHAVMKDQDRDKYKNGIEVEVGKPIEIEFRVRLEE